MIGLDMDRFTVLVIGLLCWFMAKGFWFGFDLVKMHCF
jgi:hypothetical protein